MISLVLYNGIAFSIVSIKFPLTLLLIFFKLPISLWLTNKSYENEILRCLCSPVLLSTCCIREGRSWRVLINNYSCTNLLTHVTYTEILCALYLGKQSHENSECSCLCNLWLCFFWWPTMQTVQPSVRGDLWSRFSWKRGSVFLWEG